MKLKLVLIASATLSLAAAAGCINTPSDSLPIGGQGGAGSAASGPASSSSGAANNDSPARKFYVANVHPLLTSGAQPCATCHAVGMLGAPMFLDPVAETAYDKLAGFPGLITAPENSLLLLHGLHTGPAMSMIQHDTTTTWLTMEAQERGLAGPGSGSSSATSSSSGGGGKPTDLASALTMFGKCMDPTEWKNDGLDQLAKVTTNNYGPCNNCHASGDGGNYLNSADPQTTFSKQQIFPFVKRWVSGTYDMDGNFTGLKAVPREYLKADEAKLCDPAKEACHPRFTMPAAMMTGIDTFIQSTLTKMQNNLCP